MKILVTGAAGYIGSVLCPALLAEGHSVIAIDNFRYGLQQATALAACCVDPGFHLVKGDTRDLRTLNDFLAHVDAVIPLAAIVGAPACDLDVDSASGVNYKAIRDLVDLLSNSQRIIYPNTNSGYGRMPEGVTYLTEASPLNPLSKYAKTKLCGETAVLGHLNSVVFRLATVFGASPRMRTDLLVNDFVLRAVRDKSIVLYEPYAHRNFVHVRDVARAFIWALENGDGQVYNLGLEDSNLTKIELCEKIEPRVYDFRWFVAKGQTDIDKRDYIVSNKKVLEAGFRFEHSLDGGIVELINLYQGFPMTAWGNV